MNHDDLAMLTDAEVLGTDGVSLGQVEEVFLDRGNDLPAWVTVPGEPRSKTLPLADARFDEQGRLNVPYDAVTVASAPEAVPEDGRIWAEQEADLTAHYGLPRVTSEGEPELPGVPTAGEERDGERHGGAQI